MAKPYRQVRTNEATNRWPNDQKLRAHGFEIAERPANGQAKWRWRKDGKVYLEGDAMEEIGCTNDPQRVS